MKTIPIPSSFNAEQGRYLRDTVTVIGREIADCIGKNEPVSELYLISPGKRTFVLTIDDAGVLTVAMVNE